MALTVEEELKLQKLQRRLRNRQKILQAAIGQRQLYWERVKQTSPAASLYSADLREARADAERAGYRVKELEREIATLEETIWRIKTRPGLFDVRLA